MDAHQVLNDLSRYPRVERYVRDIIVERLAPPDPGRSPLVSLFSDPDMSPMPLEKLLREVEHVPNFAQIFDVNLGAEPVPDEKINDILAEVRGLHHLVYTRRFGNVSVVPTGAGKTVDVTAAFHNRRYAIEIKHPRGPDWKDHEQVGGTGAYRLDQGEKVIAVVRRQARDALRQISEFRECNPHQDYQGVVLLVNTRVDWSLFYRPYVQEALAGLLANESQASTLGAVASIDFLDHDGQVYYCPNRAWRLRGSVDIWPG